jgi:hypothetical protein
LQASQFLREVPDKFKRRELLYEPKNFMVTVMFPDKDETYRCVDRRREGGARTTSYFLLVNFN